MAHSITVREDGMAEMAFIGERQAIWHGLGQELSDNSPIGEWIVQAGMNWEAMNSRCEYNYVTPEGGMASGVVPDKKVLYRSDTKAPLSVVGKDFQVVQPREVMEFFADLVNDNGMKLSTAGTLFGGRRFWALAETGQEGNVVDDDTIKSFLLLATAVDGSLATTAKFVSTRVVCNNTMSVALNESRGSVVRVTHKSVFDPQSVKIDMGLYSSAWDNFMSNLKRMADTKVDSDKAKQFFAELTKQKEEVSRLKVDRLMELYEGGAGAEYSKGTAYGLLNAVTEMYTHGTNTSKSGDNSSKFWNGYNGSWSNMKDQAYSKILSEVVA
jgi:phage/plasmid-like protein (TIGR03299 family)